MTLGRRILSWGGGTALLLVGFMAARDVAGLGEPGSWLLALDPAIVFGGIVFAQVAARKRDGGIGFPRAALLGVAIAASATLLSRLWLWFWVRFHAPERLDALREGWREQLRATGASPAEIESTLADFAPTAFSWAWKSGVSLFLMGATFAVLVAVFTSWIPDRLGGAPGDPRR